MENSSEACTVDIMTLIYELLAGAERAVDQQRFELAQALAAIAQARAMADIANALRDDDNNGVAHILHNMSYTPVSYTHLTLPTNDPVKISVVAVS